MNIGNKLSAVKTVVTSKVGRQVLKTQKHSPAILFGAGVIGFGVTVVLASKATLKLDEVMSENELKVNEAHDLHELGKLDKADYSDSDYKKDSAILKVRFVKDVTRLYYPSVIVGIASVACLTGSHVILNRRFAGATAAYATLDRAFKDYQGRVTEMVGPDKERELRFGSETREVAVDTKNGTKIETITEHPTGHSAYAKLFSKDTSSSWSPQSEYNLVLLRAQQTYMNDQLQANGHLFLNEVYDVLGLERTAAGAVTGWVWNNKRGGDNYVDFGVLNGEDFGAFHSFMTSKDGALWLDFNVDGIVYDLI